MKFLFAVVLLIPVATTHTFAGDDASGPIQYSTDLSQPFTTYIMSEMDKKWSRSLVTKLKYTGSVVHFVRTSLPLTIGDSTVDGAMYQAVEKPDFFYVVKGDAMLRLGKQWPYSPGVGGFSMHGTKRRDFLLCLNFQEGGVPFLSSSPVRKGRVAWKGGAESRVP
jgi:hypothetical protein